MRIATFNLESLDLQPEAAVDLETRADILRPQLERAAADIVCLQEINGQKRAGKKNRELLALDELLEPTRYATYHRVSTSGPGGRGVADIHNLVVLSRFEILASGELRNDLVEPVTFRATSASPADESMLVADWDRPLLWADIALPNNQVLKVMNVHLRAPLAVPIAGQKQATFVWKSIAGWAEGYYVASMKRAGQALELRLALESAFDSDAHALIAVCGDFNAQDREVPLRIVTGAEEDTGNGALASRSLVPLERSTSKDRRFSALHHGRPEMPDHILVSRTLMGCFRQLEIHNEMLEDELIGYAKIDRPPDSYHAPVIAEFDIS